MDDKKRKKTKKTAKSACSSDWLSMTINHILQSIISKVTNTTCANVVDYRRKRKSVLSVRFAIDSYSPIKL